jgi:hypothetical protein
VEDTAWVAFEYLRGLNPPPDFIGYLLVWMDLLQLAYVASTFLAVAAMSRLLRGRAISNRVGRGLIFAGNSLAAVIVAGVACAVILPRQFDAVPAWAAFVASIPFMTTLLPFLLGLALLNEPTRPLPSTLPSTTDRATNAEREHIYAVPNPGRRAHPEGPTQ